MDPAPESERPPLRTVWKYQASALEGPQSTEMPAGARILHVAPHGTTGVTLWAEVQPQAPTVKRRIIVTGTGQPVPISARYLGTAAGNTGLVWHAWELD